MELIIYIFILINLFIKPNGYLSCGLFAWNGRYPGSFDIAKFKLLGMFNDTRGGDSCGVFANGFIDKGINLISKFKDFWKIYDFKLTKGAKVIIGHARKASVGTISHENAQPIGVLFKTTKNIKKGIVVAHNGTLTNYEELATKYKLNTDNLSTDSQVLAYLLHMVGWKILQEYEGSAALIITMLNEPDTMYVFKGASKSWTSQVSPLEERPLYYYQETKNSIYFSSIEDSLVMLLDDPSSEATKETKKIKEFPENILFKIKNGIMTEIQKIDRSKIVSSKSTVVYNQNFENYNKGVNKSVARRSAYYDREDIDYEVGYTGFNSDLIDSINNRLDPDREILNVQLYNAENFLYYCRLRYYLNHNLASGSKYVTEIGRAYENYSDAVEHNDPACIRKLYFYNGILLQGKEEYQAVIKLIALQDNKDTETYYMINQLEQYSVYPIRVLGGSGFITKRISGVNTQYFSGSFQPMFHYREYKIDNGSLIKITDKEKTNGNNDIYCPSFSTEYEVFVDAESTREGYDVANLDTYTFDFNDNIHESLTTKSIKNHDERLRKAKEKINSVIILPDRTSTNSNDLSNELLASQIKKIKEDLINVVEDYQEDLAEIGFCGDTDTMSLYNKCTKFVESVTNDLPF